MSLLSACRQTARRTFRIQSLRPEQELAMLAVLNGRDALVALPTGFGKSLIYQVPAMIFERPTIVISPLIALMADQESALRRCGVPVVALHSRLRAAERRTALERLKKGGRLVVLTTPETLESAATAPLFERARPALLCIDEAHCISEWGHDFRPSYLRLGDARKRLGNPPALALTATATPRVREDIAERLRLDKPRVIVAPAHRENLRLTVDIVPGSEKFRAAARRIKRLQRPGIIYCATTTAVDEVSGALGRARIPVTRYHGKMRAADRDAAQRQFMNPSRRLIMVATTAFGMGIDKPNIRYILHYQTPGSLEQYVQEIGRAGRDGHPAHCILLFDPADLEIQEHLQALSRPSVRHLERLEDALTAWTSEQRAPTPETLAYSAGVTGADLRGAGVRSSRRPASLSGIRKAASTSWCRPRTSKTACAISSRSSRLFAMRANGVFDCFPTTRSRRNAGACSSGATLERTTHRVVERATAAEPMGLVFSSRTLHREDIRDPTENLSRIGRVSLLLNSQRLLTPLLDRAASQQQKQHPGDRHHQQLPGRQAAQHAQSGGHPNQGGLRRGAFALSLHDQCVSKLSAFGGDLAGR